MLDARHSPPQPADAPARSWAELRRDFPILRQTIHGRPLVYLDSAASSQMPQPVIDALVQYHSQVHSNVHRGVHTLSQRATDAFEGARERVRAFINARHTHECIFVRGATEGINLVMQSWGRAHVREGDEIVVSAMEHHSNIVPWQLLCQQVGARLRVIPMTDRGELELGALDALLHERTRLVAVTHVSNALGTINPVEAIIQAAHARQVPVLVDGCQAAPHMALDMQALDADFYTFSGHKMLGPTGIGVLYGKEALLEAMPPFMGGGDMIQSVSWEGTTYNSLPYKFEAGTPSIAAAVALGAAIEYLEGVGMARIQAREAELLAWATTQLIERVPGLRLFGTAPHKASVISFDLEGVHPHDIGTVLDSCGVAVRAGQHCAEPVMTRLGIQATARASLALYNDESDIEALIEGLGLVRELFG